MTWFDLNASPMVLIRQVGDVATRAPLSFGPDGFLVATFPDGEQIATTKPNVLLTRKTQGEKKSREAQRKPAARVLKRPSAKRKRTDDDDESEEEDDGSGDEEDEQEEPQAAGDGFHEAFKLDYYKKNHCVGLRVRADGMKQLMSYGGAKAKCLTEDDLRQLGTKIGLQILSGEVPQEKAAAKTAVDALVLEAVEAKTSCRSFSSSCPPPRPPRPPRGRPPLLLVVHCVGTSVRGGRRGPLSAEALRHPLLRGRRNPFFGGIKTPLLEGAECI